MKQSLYYILPALLSLLLGLLLGSLLSQNSHAHKLHADPYARLDSFAEVLSLIEAHHVSPPSRMPLIEGAIHGLLRALDPYSSYMSAEERLRFEQQAKSQVLGIGVELGIRDDELRIISVQRQSPAAKAGLSSGDRILAIDGQDVSNLSFDVLVRSLRGAAGTELQLLIKHPDRLVPKSYRIQRELVQFESLYAIWLQDNYAYIHLRNFGPGASRSVAEALENLESYASEALRGLILDLRGNPGGLLTEGLDLAGLFLKGLEIVSIQGRDGRVLKRYMASHFGKHYTLPLAILIDGSTASSSEIVAGALQDQGRAIVVGKASFGKASVQNLFELSDGATLKLTVAQYFTPSGKNIAEEGIQPDIEIARLGPEIAPQAMPASELPSSPNESPKTPSQAEAIDGDFQLGAALAALKARAAAQAEPAPAQNP